MPGNSDQGESSDDSSGDDRGEETLNLEELQKQNLAQAKAALEEIEANFDIDEARVDIDEITLKTDGGQSQGKVDQIFTKHFEKMMELVRRLIILMGLIVVAVFLWRLGTLLRLVGIPAP